MAAAPRDLIVLAIGGNSLIKDEGHRTVPDQWALARDTCHHIAQIVEAGHRVVVTHGNGPQVGFILRRSELASHELHEVPLDSCDADTQGAIGYMIDRGHRQRQTGILAARHARRRNAVALGRPRPGPDDAVRGRRADSGATLRRRRAQSSAAAPCGR